jgi:hypothetical protein
MPKVDPDTGQPVTDDPDQEDESARGGKLSDGTAAAGGGGGGAPRTTTGPVNEREAQPGAIKSPEEGGPGGGAGAQGSGSE